MSIKSQNLKWLVLLALADVLAVLLFVAPEMARGARLTSLGVDRAFSTIVIPVLVLLLVNVLPHEVKSTLVFWKLRNSLPGCQAFTKYGPGDPRIDMAALKKNVGAFPTEPTEQNAKWYKLYKAVPTDPTVRDAHQHFLMYRDMAALSFLLVVLVPAALYFVDAEAPAIWLAAAAFLGQYLLTAISARWSGVRFVCNVLAVHSARRVK